jgi:hypothetical protein
MNANPLHLGTGAPSDPNLPFSSYLDLATGIFWQKSPGTSWVQSTLTLAALSLGNGAVLTAGSGAPTNGALGTGAGSSGPGSLYVDVAGCNLYQNTGTLASPVWTEK